VRQGRGYVDVLQWLVPGFQGFEMINYLLGNTWVAPDWYYGLPLFFIARCTGEHQFEWLGIVFEFGEEVDIWGKTLFMVWKELRK
jgi:hypothetical protein